MIHPTKKEFIKKAKPGQVFPIYREISSDLETPVSAFKKINHGKYGFLLESVEGGEKIGRYSFVGSDPLLTYTIKDNVVTINRGGSETSEKIDGNPLETIRSMFSKFDYRPNPDLPRFSGGAVGYFGYGLVQYFYPVKQNNYDEIQLPDACFMVTDTMLIFDHLNQRIKIVANAFVEDDPKIAYENAQEKIKLIIQDLTQPINEPPFEINDTECDELESNFSKEDFCDAVLKAKEYIKAGDIFQVVLSQRFKVPLTVNSFMVYRALRAINPSPYMFYLKLKDFQLVGASPEIMVRQEGRQIVLRPIAGTRKRGKNDIEDMELEKDLLSDPKELAEHMMLVDLGRNDVGRVAKYHSVKLTEFKKVERYSHVMHIVSNVVGEVQEGKDALDVFEATFPAGTVTGAPKIRAMQIIEELEPDYRGPYAGAVGYIDFSGNLDTCIAIRTIVVKDQIAYIQSGAGIVADSIPEKEYEETCNKAKALLRAIDAVRVELW